MKRRDALLAAGASLLFPAGALAQASGVPVLMYHAVNDTLPVNRISRGLTVTTGDFEAQLQYLAEQRIPTLTAANLIAAVERGVRPHGVVLTFDDGYADAGQIVVPLLVRYAARATFFINSGHVGMPNHLTWYDLREMDRVGMELGAHGAYHVDLTTLDYAGQMREAGVCVERIAQYTGVRPVSYAYASGKYNTTTFEVMRELGITSAWTERLGTVREARDPYQLPRLRVTRDGGIGAYASLVRA